MDSGVSHKLGRRTKGVRQYASKDIGPQRGGLEAFTNGIRARAWGVTNGIRVEH